ncbi:MAG: ABC transporter ATP-binding protein [Thermoplasmata archaeon]
MSGPAVVELIGVSKRYERHSVPVVALREVSLAIRPGEYLSIEGPSGCGKTTLLNLLGLLDVPSAGEIRWAGAPMTTLSERERSRRRLSDVGFVFQRFYLLPTLTAEENVELPMRAAGRPRAERRARARALLEAMGIGSRAGALPHQLSGGEEQRVAIARALANDPSLVLADEPTGELDSASAEVVMDRLEEAHRRRGTALVVVTHNPSIAARARRHIRVADGRIVSDREEN